MVQGKQVIDWVEESANELINRGIPVVIITLGRNGAIITTEKFQKKIPIFGVDNVIDTTRAGDTFNGAFYIAYWIRKWDIEKSVKYANVVASLKIQKLGARSGMPFEGEFKKFVNRLHLNSKI